MAMSSINMSNDMNESVAAIAGQDGRKMNGPIEPMCDNSLYDT